MSYRAERRVIQEVPLGVLFLQVPIRFSVVVSPANSQLAGVLVVLINLMLNGVFVTHTRMGQIGQQLMAGSYAYHVSAGRLPLCCCLTCNAGPVLCLTCYIDCHCFA